MANNGNSKKKLTFRYEQSPNYRSIYSNGAFGGITPPGEIRFDLFFEYSKTPEEITHSLTPDGLGPEIQRKPGSAPVTREVLMGVVMSKDGAKNLAHWLLQKVQDLDAIEKQKKRQ
jgi:hypothetical protein